MTVDELKAEASKLGYNIVKRKPYVAKLPCPICGSKVTTAWHSNGRTRCKCKHCGFAGDWSNTLTGNNKAWNNAVERYKEEIENDEN